MHLHNYLDRNIQVLAHFMLPLLLEKPSFPYAALFPTKKQLYFQFIKIKFYLNITNSCQNMQFSNGSSERVSEKISTENRKSPRQRICLNEGLSLSFFCRPNENGATTTSAPLYIFIFNS